MSEQLSADSFETELVTSPLMIMKKDDVTSINRGFLNKDWKKKLQFLAIIRMKMCSWGYNGFAQSQMIPFSVLRVL